MSLRRRWLLISWVLVLGGGSLAAASTREDRAYAAAVATFNAEIWGRAETEFTQFRQWFPKSSRLAAAVLLQAQAEYKQGKFENTLALLTDAGNLAKAGELADQYYYWTAQAQFHAGNYELAAKTFTAIAAKFPQSPLVLTAVVEGAAAHERLGDWAKIIASLGDAGGVFQRVARAESGVAVVVRGQLLLARALAAQKDFAGAEAVLANLKPPTLNGEQAWQCVSLGWQNKFSTGDWESALAATTDLLAIARRQNNAEWLAEAQAMRGTALEKLNRLAEAGAAWSENLTNLPVAYQSNAVLQVAALAAAQNNFSNAAAALENFIARFPGSPVAELALLTLGELDLKNFVILPVATNQLPPAREKFDQLLAAGTNGPLAGRAYLGRGWCSWLAGNPAAALADFSAAAERLPLSEALAVARFKAGDARLALGDSAGARMNYRSVLADFGGLPVVAKSLDDRAFYQILRADLQLRDAADAAAVLRQLLNKFPTSELADNSLLLTGEGFSDFSSPNAARELFAQFEKQFPDSPLLPETKFAAARTFEREQNWKAAIAGYQGWLNRFRTNALRPQVEYALGQANFRAGNETNAFALLADFGAQFPTNELVPLAQWWVAEHYFRAGDFGGAETNYENIFQNPSWKNSPLYYPSLLMAGRAAIARQGFPDANHYFEKLLGDTNCPASLAGSARLAYAASLMQTPSADTNNAGVNFQLATNVLSQLPPTNRTGVLALSEIGDCVLQLGDFDGATNVYAQVASSLLADAGLRSRARVGLGLALEKKAALLPPAARKPLLDLALKYYLDVIGTAFGKDLEEGETADAFWLKKAGLQALPLLSPDSCPTNFFNQLKKLLPSAKELLEKKKVAITSAKT